LYREVFFSTVLDIFYKKLVAFYKTFEMTEVVCSDRSL